MPQDESGLNAAGLDSDALLRRIAEGTASATGVNFFRMLVQTLGAVLGTRGAWVTEFLPQDRALRGLAFWLEGTWIPNYYTKIDGTPCEIVVTEKRLVHYADGLRRTFPRDQELEDLQVASYIGVPLLDANDDVIGHLAVLDSKPMPLDPRMVDIFRIFAARATAEVQRLRAEREVREREEKLGRLVSGAMDAIVEFDDAMCISQFNPAAEVMFGAKQDSILGCEFGKFLSEKSAAQFAGVLTRLQSAPDEGRSAWLPELEAHTLGGGTFPAEATVSLADHDGRHYYTVVLRNVNDRREAERRIESLTREREYLKQELREAYSAGSILGESAPMRRLLEDLRLVAVTPATVLILGETGTGKELVARAIHDASPRRDAPLVKVNCAAIPAALIESEFFGHERGAFTGATERREGRFALAHGGTIFLDEVGEIPLDLQSKLLRVLQEGEFEPVGSSKTRKIDVRVVAATNRDLAREVREGKFREDLYYRLNVFPVQVPPLRDRGDDVIMLAEAFVERFAARMRRTFTPMSSASRARLKSYSWPGNVRELENIIERATITSLDGQLNIDRALPGDASPGVQDEPNSERILTVAQLQELERASILRALEQAGWRVAGDTGAAKRLGVNPSTLSSRMKALGIARPKSS